MKLDLPDPIRTSRNGRPYWLWPDGKLLPVISGGEGPTDPAPDPKPDPQPKPDPKPDPEPKSDPDDKGFPENTPVAEMTDKQAAAYWKFQSRKHESRANERRDYDDLKTKASEYDKLVEASKSEKEREVSAAREETEKTARADERAKASVRLVDAEMRAAAAAKGVDAEKLKVVLEPLDRTKFLDAEGEVDLDKVAAFIAGVAPSDTGTQKGGRFPDLGQGRRQGDGGKPSLESGKERWRSRHPAKTQ